MQQHETAARLSRAYSATPARADRKATARASGWRYNADLEALIRQAETDPSRLDTLDPGLRMQLGLYKQDKEAATAAGIDTSKEN